MASKSKSPGRDGGAKSGGSGTAGSMGSKSSERLGGGEGRYSGLRDMLDGGGPGRDGKDFRGAGAVSAGLNRVGLNPIGGGSGYGGIRDMFDGGGPGRAGTSFEGAGFLSAGMNRAGVRPYDSVMGPPAPAQQMAERGGGGEGRQAAAPLLLLPTNTPTTELEDRTSLTGAEVSAANAANSMVPSFKEGGMVGPGGKPLRPSTREREFPAELWGLMGQRRPSYAAGGMVGPGGVPQRPMASPMAMDTAQQGGAPVVGMAAPGAQGRPLNFAAIDQEAQRFMQQQPQQVAAVRAEVEQAMASGEVDAQSLNMFVQMATAALQNPDLWPQLRQALINQGMLDAADVGPEYDQGLLIVLYIIGKSMGGGAMTTPAPQQGAPMSAGQAPQMSMSEGGPLPPKSENPDGSIPINAHEGEYVIPADVTRKLGTDHFDRLIAKARGADNKGEQ